MDKKHVEQLGKVMPLLGYGCMRFPVKDDKIDFEKAKELIHHAYNSGINYFDTAYNYHGGESERFLGKVLPEFKRDSYYLTSKLPVWKVESEEDAEKLFNEQLQKCNTEYFDFYLLHSLNKKTIETVKKFNLYDFIAKKKAEGKIKHIGFSFHDSNEVLKEFAAAYKWDFVQLQINYWDWEEDEAKSQYETLEKLNIPCFVMEPVRGGFLASFAPHVMEHLKNYNPDASIASWALRWVASLPNVALILSGMSNMEQLNDNIKTFTNLKPIEDDEQKVIDKVVDDLRKIKPVPCTGCRYCMECPYGVDIPGIFDIYNDYKKSENKQIATRSYFVFTSDEKRADKCQECGECVTKCPQQINIPEELKVIHKEMTEIKAE
ncbi:aldo/keto reductase [Sedimentibacter hydroxybenzoicus DSM 7310]|uniref:Aldo/keto reductase n=1 Tax=Sedimentibacter hydroxybenzoicus DSM 7310 TaxID=1123245 RepID=A0A974BKN1_SEDHY|nr:aldo/keto reductase [Sedimentibacter hydroxybenzoicus]NYB74626.1 aldo/keto reductase [Sedimentibacter hydroxybenzoicus DSM 7310]